jgi:hypothetical protein
MAGAGLFWEKSTAGWLLVAGLVWEKSTAGWWLISQANRAHLYCGVDFALRLTQHPPLVDNTFHLRIGSLWIIEGHVFFCVCWAQLVAAAIFISHTHTGWGPRFISPGYWENLKSCGFKLTNWTFFVKAFCHSRLPHNDHNAHNLAN